MKKVEIITKQNNRKVKKSRNKKNTTLNQRNKFIRTQAAKENMNEKNKQNQKQQNSRRKKNSRN